jgi:hypothetical protein
VRKSAKNLERSFSEVRSTKTTLTVSTPGYFCQVCEYPYTESPKEDWIQCSKGSLCSDDTFTS